MNSALHLIVVAGGAALLRAICSYAWKRYKARKMLEPIPMRLRNGVHEPWGAVQRAERLGRHFVTAYIVMLALIAAILIYRWLE